MKNLGARLFRRSFLLQAGFSDERRQALGFAWTVDPALVAAYGSDADGLREARLRHLRVFNTQPNAAGLLVGACAALEARAAAGDAGAAARVDSFKGAIGASLAGGADALFWGSLRPLAAAAAALLGAFAFRRGTAPPLLAAAAAGLLVFNVPALVARRRGVERGLADPDGAALGVAALPVQSWIRSARLAAAVMIFLASTALIGHPLLSTSATLAAGAFAFGAAASAAGATFGPLRLVAAAGILGAAASAAVGWTP